MFNILFVTDNKKHLVYCQDCAKKTSINLAGFIVLNQVGIFRSDGIQFTILRAHSCYRPDQTGYQKPVKHVKTTREPTSSVCSPNKIRVLLHVFRKLIATVYLCNYLTWILPCCSTRLRS